MRKRVNADEHRIVERELATRLAALQTVGAVLLVRHALFLAARFGNEAVKKILPYGPVLLKIDLHGHAASLAIGERIESRL
jgi:hypothetical protein